MEVFIYCLISVVASVPAINGLNLGLASGDLRRTINPLIIKKPLHRAPLTIPIKPGKTNLPQIPCPLTSRKLSPKHSLLKKKMKPLSKKLPLKHKLLKIRKTRKLPMLPKLPLLPLLPILPPIIPKLPLLPLTLLPVIPPLPLLPPTLPSVSKLLKPLRVPIITKSRLQKALSSELKPVSIPVPNLKQRKNILQKLLNLRNRGTLTGSQFLKLKKVLLQNKAM